MYKHVYTCTHLYAGICQRFSLGSGPQPFRHQGPVWWKTICPQTAGWGGGQWFQDDRSTLCTLFLLLSHQHHLRSSGIRIQRMGTPALEKQWLKNLGRRGKLEWAWFGRAWSRGSRVSHRWVATFPRQREQLRMLVKPEMTNKTHEWHGQVYSENRVGKH